MKKVLFIMIGLLFLLPVTITSADVGPKPSVVVTIRNIEEDFYFDVLQYEDGDISQGAYDMDALDYYYDDVFPEELIGFQDDEGYASYTLYHCCGYGLDQEESTEDSHVFALRYYRPQVFKIVLVLKESRNIIVSDVIRADRFNATVTWDLSDVDLTESSEGAGVISGEYEKVPLFNTIHLSIFNVDIEYNLVVRIVMTLMIELGILWLFRIKDKKFVVLVIVMNIITQFILNSTMFYAYTLTGVFLFILLLLFMEFVITMIEMFAYLIYARKKHALTKIIFYVLAANLSSFVVGEIVFRLL